MTQTSTSDLFRQTACVTGVVLTATTFVIAIVTAFVVATEIFLILFLAMLFGVFLTKTAARVSSTIPIGYGAGVAVVTTLLLVAGIGFVALFGVQLDHEISEAGNHLDQAQLTLRETVDRYPTIKSVLTSTPILRDFHWLDNHSSSKPKQDTDDSSKDAGQLPKADRSKGNSANGNGGESLLESETLSAAAIKGVQAIGELFQTTFGLILNGALIFFVGLFLAVAPDQYRDGLVVLFPKPRRKRTRDILDRIEKSLWNWLIGRFGSMLITGLGAGGILWFAGVPMAVFLGLVTGLLTFVPNIGSLIALTLAVLFSLPQGGSVVMIVVVGYMGLQVVESYVATPLIQQHQVSLQPALLLAFQALMGVLFGFLGAAVASPLLAAVKTGIEEAYIMDVLGDEAE